MHSVTEQLENNQIKLLVEVPEEELTPEIESAFVKVSRQVRLPGFRPGKAPRRVLESKLGAGFARAEAISENAPKWVDAALIENEIEAISQPEITVTDGEESGDVKIDVIVEVRPDLTIEGYGDLGVEFPSPFASDEDVDKQLERLREALGSLEDSTDAVGDDSVVTLDLEVAGEGAEPNIIGDYVFRIGAQEPYSGLSVALRSKSVGDSFEFDSVVTEEPDVDSEPAFSIHIGGVIKAHQSLVRPELNDDFAKDASEFETLAELREDMKKSVESFRKSVLRNSWRQILAEKLGELAGLNELPGSLLQMEFETISHNFGHRIENSGLSFAKYLELANTTAEEISTRLASEAIIETRLDLGLRALAKAESLAATEEEIATEVSQLAAASGMDDADALEKLRSGGQLVGLKREIAKKKAMDWLFANANFVDDKGNALSRADLTGEAIVQTTSDQIADSDIMDEPALELQTESESDSK